MNLICWVIQQMKPLTRSAEICSDDICDVMNCLNELIQLDFVQINIQLLNKPVDEWNIQHYLFKFVITWWK